MLRTYALAPEMVMRFTRATFWRFQTFSTATFLIFGAYLAWFAGPVRWSVAAWIVGVIALAYFFVIFFNYRAQLRLLYSVRYEIDGSSVIYRQAGQKGPLRIMRADITGVAEHRNGLLIETVDPEVGLLVPFGLARDGDADFRSTLAAWAGITPQARRGKRLGLLLTLFTGAGTLLILLLANSMWVILPLGLFLMAFGTYAERRLMRVHDAPPGVVRMYSAAFSFLVFVIVMKSCFVGINMAVAMAAR